MDNYPMCPPNQKTWACGRDDGGIGGETIESSQLPDLSGKIIRDRSMNQEKKSKR